MSMQVSFLNVGHGDCTVVEFESGRRMMVDVANTRTVVGDELPDLPSERDKYALYASMPLEARTASVSKTFDWEDYYRSLLVDAADWFEENYPDKQLFRYIQSHPDMDHMMGLYKLIFETKIRPTAFWDTKHSKSFEKEDFDGSPYNWEDWLAYETLRLGCLPDSNWKLVSEQVRVLKLTAGDSNHFWEEDGITILSPTPELVQEANEKESWNDLSYVLRIDYAGRRLVLAGDAEKASWEAILERWDSADLKCDVLKAAHHGRLSGYHHEAVTAMDPELVICSVGKKPNTDATPSYQAHGAKVLSTRYHGTIKAKHWFDGEIWVTNHKGDRIYTVDGQ